MVAGADALATGGRRIGRHGHGTDARGHGEFGTRIEHCHEATHHQIVQLALGLAQLAWRLQRGDDGKVVAHLAVVEDAAARLDVALVDGLLRVRRQVRHAAAGQHGKGLVRHAQIVLGQVAGVGTRIGQRLVALVQALRQAQRGLGRKAELAVGLALQAGQVEQQRRCLRGGLALFRHAGGLAAHGIGDGAGLLLVPQAIRPGLGILALLPGRIEPFARILTRLGTEGGMHLPIVAADELADFLFPFDDDGQGWRLYAADGGQEEAAIARVEGRHGTRAVDAHQPVGLGARTRRIGQTLHLLVGTQLVETVADGLLRHALQPQAAHRLAQRLGAARILLDQPENQFPFAPRVTGVDQLGHVLALGLLHHRVQARLGLVHRLQVEVRRNHRQVGKAPLAALDVVLLGRLDFHQVADGTGDDVALILEVIVVLGELAGNGREGAHDVLCDGGFLCDDESFAHGVFLLKGGWARGVKTSTMRQATRDCILPG